MLDRHSIDRHSRCSKVSLRVLRQADQVATTFCQVCSDGAAGFPRQPPSAVERNLPSSRVHPVEVVQDVGFLCPVCMHLPPLIPITLALLKICDQEKGGDEGNSSPATDSSLQRKSCRNLCHADPALEGHCCLALLLHHSYHTFAEKTAQVQAVHIRVVELAALEHKVGSSLVQSLLRAIALHLAVVGYSNRGG